MKLTEVKNDDALDMLADILEPCGEIFSDKVLSAMYSNGENPIKMISYAIKNHKKEVIEIMATLEGTPIEEYECNFLSLPVKIMEIMNDMELLNFFGSQGQKKEKESFGSVTENTKAKEE